MRFLGGILIKIIREIKKEPQSGPQEFNREALSRNSVTFSAKSERSDVLVITCKA